MDQNVSGMMPVRRAPEPKKPFANSALLLTSAISGSMLWLAMPNLISGTGWEAALKSGLLALGGMVVSYVVNRLAVERGAPLMVKGYGMAGAVSVLSVATVGIGLFAATYSGLTMREVERLRVEEHGQALGHFVAGRSAAAGQSARIAPAIGAVVADLTEKRACEIADSCLSGHTGGGNGPVARLLAEKLGKASALERQVQNGMAARDQAVDRLNALYGDYERAAADGDLSEEERRRTLRGIDLTIRQAAADLDEAIPVTLIAAYGDELKAGVEIAERPDMARKISGILRPHGQTIGELARSQSGANVEAPAFPPATGVSDTFRYAAHFLPIVAITAAVELVFPMSLWLYTLLALRWAAYRASPPVPRPRHPEDEFYGVLLPAPEASAGIAAAPPAEPFMPPPDEDIRPRRTPGRGRPPANGHQYAEKA